MSTIPAPSLSANDRELKIVSHSNLFYWWPVWAVGFLMSLLTWLDGGRMVVVPTDTDVSRTWQVVTDAGGTTETREGYLVKKSDGKHTHHLAPDKAEAGGSLPDPTPAKLHMSHTGTYGVIFCATLMLVIIITNVPLRGMWSVVVIVVVILGTIILALTPMLEKLINAIMLLDIRVNMAGYLFVSVALFLIWLATIVFFDRQLYIIFTPGQLKVRTEIGGGEKAYDTAGMTVEKQRSDLFRHWILGLGSGDLVVNTSGAGVHHFDMPNVLFINKKVQEIEDMLREKAVVKGR